MVNWNTVLNYTLDDTDLLYFDAYAKQQADTLDLSEIKSDVVLINVTVTKLIENNVTIGIVDSLNSTYILYFINLQLLEELVS